MLLLLYVAAGPVLEAVHAEPADRSHSCVICSQLTERFTTPAVTFHVSPLSVVSLVAAPVICTVPCSIRHLSPDKRGPP